MNYLGIDYGEKRIGLSFGEDDVGVAVPLPAAIAKKKSDRFLHIGKYITERRVEKLVIGYPYHMNGSKGKKIEEVEYFIKELTALFDLPVERVDERLTSHLVESQFKSMGRKWDRKSGEVDSCSATVILQDYLTHALEM
tara:strand:+ start:323 stop:739 length:417 start_codon:yes stop_codon:yes gene_type:complete